MIAAPVQCDVDGVPKGSHYISVSTIKVRLRRFLINGHGRLLAATRHAIGSADARTDAFVGQFWRPDGPPSSGTPTSRCRSVTAGRRVRARGSPPGAGRAATGTRVALRSRPLLPARRHVRP